MRLWLTLIHEAIEFINRPINLQLEVIMSNLSDAKSLLQANSVKLDKIGTETEGLKASNDALLLKIQELQSQQPDNALVADIIAMVTAQGAKLDTIDSMVDDAQPPADTNV